MNPGHRDLQVFKVLQVLEATMGDQVHQVIPAHLVILALLGPLDRRVILVLLVHQDQR